MAFVLTEQTLRELLLEVGDFAAYEGKHWQYTHESQDDGKYGGKISRIIEQALEEKKLYKKEHDYE